MMVLSVVAVSGAFAGSAAAASVDRQPSETSVAPGGTVDVELDITADEGDGIELVTGSFSSDLTVTGSSSQAQFIASDGGYEVVYLSAVDSDTIEYTVEVPEDAAGETYDISGSIVTTNDEVDSGTTTINVEDDGTTDPPTDPPEADNPGVDSGSTYWAGQERDFDISDVSSSTVVQVREYDTTDDVIEGLEDEFNVGSDGQGTLDTEGLSGSYVIVPADSSSEAFVFEDGVADTTASGSDELASAGPEFEVQSENLELEFTDGDGDSVDTVDEDGSVYIDSSSARASYDFIVSADGDLDEDELADIFDEGPTDVNQGVSGDQEDDYDVDDDTSIILENAEDYSGDDEDHPVNFTDIDLDEFDFRFIVEDTGVEAEDTIEHTEDNVDANFADGTITESAGDVLNVSVNFEDTDNAYVQIGDEDSGFIDVVYVEDDDGDDNAHFTVNTRTLGTQTDGSATPQEDVYDAPDDIIASETHGSDFGEIYYVDADTDDNVDFEGYLDELNLIDQDGDDDEDEPTDQLTRPMQPTDYELTAADFSDNDVVFGVNNDGQSVADTGFDSALLELTTPEIAGVTTHVAPEEDANEDDSPSDLLDVVTQRSEVATGDRLIVQVQATGFEGALEYEEDGALEDGTTLAEFSQIINDDGDDPWAGEGINFEVVADDATGNQDATELDLGNENEREGFVVFDPANEQFFVVVDTSADDDVFTDSIGDGDDFTATMEYLTDSDDQYEFNYDGGSYDAPYDGEAGAADSTTDANPAYPYFQADSDQSASASFSVAERSITFDNLNEAGVLQAAQSDAATISGSTNVAPGSDAELRISSTDASTSFRNGQDANITEDGSVTAEFDLSDQEVGDAFETSLTIGGTSVDTVDSTVVEAVEETDDGEETNETDTDDGEEMDDGEEPADDGETNESTGDDGESTDDGTPGFGAVVALIALIGAALLAVRRQN